MRKPLITAVVALGMVGTIFVALPWASAYQQDPPAPEDAATVEEAVQGDGSAHEEEPPREGEDLPPERRREDHTGATLEMHWGFPQALEPAQPEADLWLPMDGRITISDGDPDTREGVRVISALLFEHGGSYEEGRADALQVPNREAWTDPASGLTYVPWVAWRSATTTDWDGIAVRFRWEKGTNPTVTIETSQWSVSLPAEELKSLPRLVEIGPQGQTLEMGRFFTLTYKVYDLALEWGYDIDLDEDGVPSGETVAWDGSLSVDQGGLYLLKPRGFEEGDEILPRGELDPVIPWRTTTEDVENPRAAADGIALNIVAPRGSRPVLTVVVNGEELQFQLPARFRDAAEELVLDSQGHFVRGHLHWCWWKSS